MSFLSRALLALVVVGVGAVSAVRVVVDGGDEQHAATRSSLSSLSSSLSSSSLSSSSSSSSSSSRYIAPNGGVYLWGWKASNEQAAMSVFEVDMATNTVNRSYLLPLSPPLSLVPRLRVSAVDAHTGRVGLFYTTPETCELRVWQVDTRAGGDHRLAPHRAYTLPFGAQACSSSSYVRVQLLFDASTTTTTYLLVGTSTETQLWSVSGTTTTGTWRSLTMLANCWGPAAIDASRAVSPSSRLYIVNTTLLAARQNILYADIDGSSIGGVGLARAAGQDRLASLSFPPPSSSPSSARVLGAAPGTVGHIVAINRTSSPYWSYSTVMSTNQRFSTYVFDRTHSMAFAGSPSWCDAYNMALGGAPAAAMVLGGSWNSGGVLPFTA